MRHILTWLGIATARPWAFLIVIFYGATWWWFHPQTFEWHGIATLATWMMTLFIQRAEHRDTQAMHAKLDELLRSHGEARGELASLDEKEPEEIEEHRANQQSS